MPRLLSQVVVFATSMAILITSAGATQLESTSVDLRQRQAAFLAALAARDATRTGSFFAENAVVHAAGMPPVRGRKAITEFYGKLFDFALSLESESETLRVSAGGDLAYDAGEAKNAFKSQQGEAEFVGKYLAVWVKEQGTWLIAAYSVSNNSASR